MAPGAQVLIHRGNIHREPELARVAGCPMGIVADRARDAELIGQGGTLLHVFGIHAPGGQRTLGGVACRALLLLDRVACDHALFRHSVRGLAPLLDEGGVNTIVALPATVSRIQGDGDRRQRLGAAVRVLDMVGSRAVAALALHVVIRGVLNGVPAGGRRQGVAQLGHGVAPEAGSLGTTAGGQVGVGTRVLRGCPVGLVGDVAVPTGGLLVGGREIPQETGRFVRRGIERLAEDDLLVGTPGEEGEEADERPEATRCNPVERPHGDRLGAISARNFPDR